MGFFLLPVMWLWQFQGHLETMVDGHFHERKLSPKRETFVLSTSNSSTSLVNWYDSTHKYLIPLEIKPLCETQGLPEQVFRSYRGSVTSLSSGDILKFRLLVVSRERFSNPTQPHCKALKQASPPRGCEHARF